MRAVDLRFGDFINILPCLNNRSVDLFLCDLPYGMTECHWDKGDFDLTKMWGLINEKLKPNGVVALTASQPFTSILVMSNLPMFKHEWIWIKNRGSNFANTVREPMKEHESVLIFANRKWKYNKQMQERSGGGVQRANYLVEHNNQKREGTRQFEGRKHHKINNLRVPSSWQKFNVEVGLHPTQKPVPLFEYLIKTYTDELDLVCDFCMRSGTTGVACIRNHRNFLGIEKDMTYFDIAQKRIEEEFSRDDVCQECGDFADSGSCYFCKMD